MTEEDDLPVVVWSAVSTVAWLRSIWFLGELFSDPVSAVFGRFKCYERPSLITLQTRKVCGLPEYHSDLLACVYVKAGGTPDVSAVH
jgi:hypothetical protein